MASIVANELMLALSTEVDRNDRYSTPPALLTSAGQRDRRHEADHVVAVRDEERKARERVVLAASEAVGDIAWLEARAKVNTEAKYALHRAHRESMVIADGDPELQAKFGMLDDDYFADTRGVSNRSRPTCGGLFG